MSQLITVGRKASDLEFLNKLEFRGKDFVGLTLTPVTSHVFPKDSDLYKDFEKMVNGEPNDIIGLNTNMINISNALNNYLLEDYNEEDGYRILHSGLFFNNEDDSESELRIFEYNYPITSSTAKVEIVSFDIEKGIANSLIPSIFVLEKTDECENEDTLKYLTGITGKLSSTKKSVLMAWK